MKFFIAAGSNINPEDMLKRAAGALSQRLCIRQASTFYRNAPVGMLPDTPDFINGMFVGETDRLPVEIWRILRCIEDKYGRIRSTSKYISRTLDLDLILYGDWVLNTRELTIPDRDIGEREFLSVPLAELDPGIGIPGMPGTIQDIVPEHHSMIPLPRLTAEIRAQIDINRRIHEH